MKNKNKILVVDDDPQALMLMEALLTPHGYDVVLINDDKQAIQTARKENPNLILLDIMMPGRLDGYTIVKKLKEDETMKNIPVIMVSSLELDGNKVFASIAGASAYITKPVDSKHLIETVARFLPDSTS
jgi:CheY-like chemotaxis protein